MNFIKKNIRIILFIIVSFIQIFYLNSLFYDYDATWEYGLCHALIRGEVPYIDFNLITTPLFIFLFSIGLLIKDSFIVILIETFILNIIVFYFVDKVLEKKSIIYMFSLCGLCFFALLPTYNSLVFYILILIICFEKLEYSDKLIGFLWGLLILSKHTIGLPIVFIVIIGLIIKKCSIKKIMNRIIYMGIPLFLFLSYLIDAKSSGMFFDLCILGLFNFASNNFYLSIYLILSIIIFIISFIFIIKDNKNILIYYLIGSIMFVIPIFDKSHIAYYILIFIFICSCNNMIKYYKKLFILLIICLFVCFIYNRSSYMSLEFTKLNHYDYILLTEGLDDTFYTVNKKLAKFDNYYFIDEIGMFYDIVYDREITYFDLPHYGNYGYNGVNNMLNMIKSEKDCYFIIRTDYVGNQIVREAIDYIADNYDKVESIDDFSIYYKK